MASTGKQQASGAPGKDGQANREGTLLVYHLGVGL